MKRYTRQALLDSKRYQSCQQDFRRVLLTKESYTLEEADQILLPFCKDSSVYMQFMKEKSGERSHPKVEGLNEFS